MEIVNNIWFYISIIELVAIVALLFFILNRRKQKPSKKLNKKDLLNEVGEVDFNGLIQSSFHAQGLYDSLIRKCHPDRFIDEQQRQIATELSAQLVENKHNYNKLCSIKNTAIEKLNINID